METCYRLLIQGLVGLAMLFGAGAAGGAEPENIKVSLFHPAEDPLIRFGGDELAEALKKAGFTVELKRFEQIAGDQPDVRIILTLNTPAARDGLRREEGKPLGNLEAEGFAFRRTTAGDVVVVRVVGADSPGTMYGALELAERVLLGTGLKVEDREFGPDIEKRGVKYNFPLDARTPSYDDTGDAAQRNIETMWDFEFWEAYLDAMARNRYNVLTLWNPHPFPSMIKLEDYPECALEDVCQTTLEPTYVHGAWDDPQGVTEEILNNLKVLKKMSIEQKIEFWRRVMRHAKDRGIEVYLVTWNVLVNSAAGKYGITGEQDNPKTIEYLRACVRETLLTYPDLTGFGITAGENMRSRDDEYAKEKWLWAVYGEGIREAKEREPEREVRFIHRYWQTGVENMMEEWSRYPDPFDLSFKYARARLYSSTRPPFSEALVKDLRERRLKSWWNLRNDDIFVFRWGDPEYVREFLENLPAGVTRGYYVGSDGYVWGREFVSTRPDSPRALEIDKHWFRFLLWGRLGYDLDLPREQLEQMVARRFPELQGAPLYEAWAGASKIIPLVNRFHWRNWDFMWSVEGCIDQRQGFHTVRDFIDNPTMEASGIENVTDYVRRMIEKEEQRLPVTPVMIAGQLHHHARAAREKLAEVRRAVPRMSEELRRTMADIKAMADLGDYYAEKILGAVELFWFEESGEASRRVKAIQHLEAAVIHWQSYSWTATQQYRPQLLARTRHLDWNALLEAVKRDVEIARAAD